MQRSANRLLLPVTVNNRPTAVNPKRQSVPAELPDFTKPSEPQSTKTCTGRTGQRSSQHPDHLIDGADFDIIAAPGCAILACAEKIKPAQSPSHSNLVETITDWR